MPLSYEAALAYLYPRITTIKFGLERTEALLATLGNPERLFPVIHVGGTNGKGSVSTLVAAALEDAGWRVGLYTSPHLVSFRERYLVAGRPVSEAAVAIRALDGIKRSVRPGGVCAVNDLIEGTTFMKMFDEDRYCLFAPEYLMTSFAEWTVLDHRIEDFAAAEPGTIKRFATLIARRLA